MEQQRIAAIVEHVEGLVSTVTTSENQIAIDRLQEAVQLCSRMDAAVLPVGLVLAATAALDKAQVEPFLARFPTTLSSDTMSALDRVSETLLMITDADLQASGAIAASVFVLRALPDAIVARDRILESLLLLTEQQHKSRAVRHREIFALLAQVKDRLTLDVLPSFLTQVSDALEDLACEKDVFLDDPVELIPKGNIQFDFSEEKFREARVKSGANIPTLGEEVKEIGALKERLGWTDEQAFSFITELYQRNVMDSRAKLGLSAATIWSMIDDVRGTVGSEIKGLRAERRLGGSPFSYDWETGEVLLQAGERGSNTSKLVRDARDQVLERLTNEKIDRETSALDKAIDVYRQARMAAGHEVSVPVTSDGEESEEAVSDAEEAQPEVVDEETAEVETLAQTLNLPLDQTYHVVAKLYSTAGLTFSRPGHEGISLRCLRETIETVAETAAISVIAVDAEADGRRPFHIDKDASVFKLHTNFVPLTDLMLRHSVNEHSLEPSELSEPDTALLPRYEDAEKAGSVANEHNVARLIEEFQLDSELAADSFEVMLEGCAGLQEAISIQALRVVVATLNARLGGDSSINLVTAFSRELPESRKTDNASLAWLSSHTEEDSTLIMLTFNFNYGEGHRNLSAYSDDVILEWCRHYRVEAIANSE